MLGSLWVFSLFPVKNCNEATLVQSNSSKAAPCISEMQMIFCCINSKAPSTPSHNCPSEMLEHLLLYSGFLYPSLTCTNSTKIFFISDPTALYSLKTMVYFQLSSNSDTVTGSGNLRLYGNECQQAQVISVNYFLRWNIQRLF